MPYSNIIPSSQATDAEVAAAVAGLVGGATSAADTFGEVETLLSGKLVKASNLSDLTNAATARTNLSLGNVDNTSDANKPVSTAEQTALNLKANLASPILTGQVSVTSTTASAIPLLINGDAASTVITGVNGPFIVNANATVNNWAGILFGDTIGGVASALMGVKLTDKTNHYGLYAFGTRAADGFLERFRIDNNGIASGSTVTTLARATLLDSSKSQLSLQFSAAQYALFTVNSAGKLLISSVGTTPEIIFGTAITDKHGFYGLATGVAQRAGAAQIAITDSTGGSTADQTIVDVTTAAVADPVKVNANFAKNARLLNELRTALVALNLIKGAA